MSLLLIGLNHKTAAVDVREQLAFTDAACQSLLPDLANDKIAREALVLSTCNRVEILLETESDNALAEVVELLAAKKNLAPEDFAHQLYAFSDAAAVRHLFRVASSLDSMIVGETQILGQVRQAYKIAAEAGTARRTLHKLLHQTFNVAKRVRTETKIAHNAVSISSAAVELAGEIFGSKSAKSADKLINKTVLLVGAGEMAELAAKYLIEHGVSRILIANRTRENAERLAMEFAGETIALENLADALPQADIVICSTAAEDYLITAEMICASQTARRNRRALLIDISVPRNIEPINGAAKNAFLYTVDDLKSAVTANRLEREREAVRAEEIVSEEADEFWQSLQNMNFGETLGNLRRKMQETAQQELAKQRGKLGDLSPEQEAAIERMTLSIVNQIAHPILYGLRQSHEYGAADFAETLCDLLNQEK